MANTDDDGFARHIHEPQEYAEAIAYLIALIIMTVILMYHVLKIYHTHCTDKPIGIKNTNEKPTKLEKGIGWTTLIDILLFWLCCFLAWFDKNFAPANCKNTQLTLQIIYPIAKCLFYNILCLRLYQCYGLSDLGPNGRQIVIGMITISIISLACMIIVLAGYLHSESDVYVIDDQDGSWPHYCDTGLDDSAFVIWMTGIAIFLLLQIVVSIVGFIIFSRPARKLVEKVAKPDQMNSKAVKRAIRRLEYIAFKYKVLVIVSGVSTMIWLFTYLLFQIAISASIDFIISSLTLTLLSRWHSKRLYEFLCYPCIECCDKSGYSRFDKNMEDNVDDESNKQLIIPSVDTYDIIKEIATQAKNEDKDKEMVNTNTENN